jgi:hypothetical protein
MVTLPLGTIGYRDQVSRPTLRQAVPPIAAGQVSSVPESREDVLGLTSGKLLKRVALPAPRNLRVRQNG